MNSKTMMILSAVISAALLLLGVLTYIENKKMREAIEASKKSSCSCQGGSTPCSCTDHSGATSTGSSTPDFSA